MPTAPNICTAQNAQSNENKWIFGQQFRIEVLYSLTVPQVDTSLKAELDFGSYKHS